MRVKIEIDGLLVEAERTTRVVDVKYDATQLIAWKGPRIDITDVHNVVTGSLDGVAHEVDAEVLVRVFLALEGLVELEMHLDDRDVEDDTEPQVRPNYDDWDVIDGGVGDGKPPVDEEAVTVRESCVVVRRHPRPAVESESVAAATHILSSWQVARSVVTWAVAIWAGSAWMRVAIARAQMRAM